MPSTYARLKAGSGYLRLSKYRKVRSKARAVAKRRGIDLRADRRRKAPLAAYRVWRKHPRSLDLGMKRKGRMVRVFD